MPRGWRIGNIICLIAYLLLFWRCHIVYGSQVSPIQKTVFLPNYSKSQIFVQKFNFDKTTTFSRIFHPKKIDNFLVKSKLNFWTKNEDFEQCDFMSNFISVILLIFQKLFNFFCHGFSNVIRNHCRSFGSNILNQVFDGGIFRTFFVHCFQNCQFDLKN